MTPSLAVQFNAAADGRELVIDEDCLLLSCHTSGTAAAVISLDRNSTVANTITTPANGLDENIIAVPRVTQQIAFLNFPLYAGRSLFVSCSAAGSVVLNFQLNRVSDTQ